ncbi:MAG: TonB-dependent siderophore receptor [Acidobacteria bacterium]|nr:TonB-dependent siderophore receptor [Acidobacteriota bacterium]
MKRRIIREAHRDQIRRNRRSKAAILGTSALGTLLIGTSLFAQQPARMPASMTSSAASQTAGTRPTHNFDIPGGALGTVAAAFKAATGIELVMPYEAMQTLESPGIKGVHSDEQALAQLLAGTGLSYRFVAAQTVTLDFQAAEAIDVTTTRPMMSPKYTEPLRDVPQTINLIPKQVIEEQGATTLREVLSNVPGITIAAGEGGTPAGDNLTLRGFSARNDVFVDGVRDLGPMTRDPFNLEQVEVTKGPGSAFTGRGSTGGAINLVSKMPSTTPLHEANITVGTSETRRATVDINQPMGDDRALRINLMGHDAAVPGREVVTNERWGIAPSFSLGLGSDTRWTLSAFHIEQSNISDYGIPWVPATNNALKDFRDKPAPVPRDSFYGFESRDHEDLQSDLGTVQFDHDFSGTTALRSQVRWGRSTRDSIATPPRFASNDSIAINRELRSWLTEDNILDSQTDLTARFNTGSFNHALVAGISLSRENNTRVNRTGPNSPTTLFDPNPNDTYTGVITTTPGKGDVTGDSAAIYAFDTMRIGEHWEVTGGLRWDRFAVDGVNTSLAKVERTDKMVSGRAGVVYKPRENGSVYLSYGTSLNPSLEGLSYSVANTSIEPEKTYTMETGAKWDFFRGRLSMNGALFRVEKTNARTPGVLPDDPPQVLDGRQRVDGLEFGASGSITSAWRVLTAFTHLESEIVDSNTPAEVGKELINTPKNAFSFWTTYDTPWRIQIGGGARFTDRRFGNTTNTRWVDGYWLIDAMASMPVTPRITLQLNGYNLTDKFYFDRIGGGHIVPGAARSAVLSANVKF